MRTLTLGGIAGPVLFSIAVVIAAEMQGDYSHVMSFISELGANGASTSQLMNYGGFIPAGVMLAAFGISLAKSLPRHAPNIVAAALVMLFGIAIFASGIFSCDLGCPQATGSRENLIHNRIAPITFLSLIVGAGILSLQFRRLPAWQSLWLYSLLTSVFGLIFLAALATSLDTRVFTGLWQRLLLGTLFLWCMVIGIHAFRHKQSRPAV